jgi:hypothetical protein
MRMFMILSLAAILSGCDETPSQKPKVDHNQPVEMNGDHMKRYETNEVVCFRVIDNSGIWCHWKGEQPK